MDKPESHSSHANNRPEDWQCVVCGSTRSHPKFSGPDRMYRLSEFYQLSCCDSCGTIGLDPQLSPEKLTQIYPPGYAPYLNSNAANPITNWLYQYGVRKQINAITAITGLKHGLALDIGCARGDFLAALRNNGWQVQGVEINATIANEARLKYAIEVEVGDFQTSKLPSNIYHLITLWDVLEHLQQPRQALRKALHLASPGGWLMMSLPDPDSLDQMIFRSFWAGWDIPRHQWLYPRQALIQLLAEEGWTVRKVKWMRGRHWLFSLSMRYWVEAQPKNRLRKAIQETIDSWVGRVLLWPYFSLIELLGRGSIYVMVAQKTIS